MTDLILASTSTIRAHMLKAAGLTISQQNPKVDEAAIRASLVAEHLKPRDIADALAEAKAQKLSMRHPDNLVLGCDQVLVHNGIVVTKCDDRDQAANVLSELRGNTHSLYSAACVYQRGQPIWRHVGHARLTMRVFSDAYLESYLTRNWDAVRRSAGCYHIEGEGIRLFSTIQGDQFTIMGLPLLELLSLLTLRGDIEG